MSRVLFLLAVSVFLVACGKEKATPPPPNSGTGGGNTCLTEGQVINFQTDLKPILDAHCYSCHQPGGSAVSHINLKDTVAFKSNATSGIFVDYLKGTRTPRMPFGEAALPNCDIEKFERWIQQGAIFVP